MRSLAGVRRAAPLLALLLAAAPAAHAQVPWSPRPPETAVKNPPFPRDDAEFLRLAARRLLGREPLPGESERWRRQVASGSPGRERLVLEIISSDEYFVRRLFLDLLGREPGTGEMSARLAFLREGGRRGEVLRNLLESEEYRSAHP